LESVAAKRGLLLARYRRPFRVGGVRYDVVIDSRLTGLFSELRRGGDILATDYTPVTGPEAIRNHQLASDGLDVEAGYINWLTVGIAVRSNGILLHESHPGRTIAYPASAAKMVTDRNAAGDPSIDMAQFKRNRVPILVDVLLGLLFSVVAKLTDLSTAALVGAGAGLALVLVQRFVKVDLLGGLALFGIFMLLVSAGLAILFQDDMAVKMRSTFLGAVSASAFLVDGLFGGNRLGRGLARYLPYTDIDPGRLAVGLGLLSFLMAGLNIAAARLLSTDGWLFYSTFVDFFLVMLMMLLVFRYARGRLFRGSYKPQAPESA